MFSCWTPPKLFQKHFKMTKVLKELKRKNILEILIFLNWSVYLIHFFQVDILMHRIKNQNKFQHWMKERMKRKNAASRTKKWERERGEREREREEREREWVCVRERKRERERRKLVLTGSLQRNGNIFKVKKMFASLSSSLTPNYVFSPFNLKELGKKRNEIYEMF